MKLKLPKLLTLSAKRRKTVIPTLLGLLVTFGFYMAYIAKPATIEQMGNLLFDQYQRWAPREYDPDVPVRIIDIDDESLERLGQWPWPRSLMAQLNDRLTQAGAGVIAYDVIFSEKDRTSPENIMSVLAANPMAKGDFDNVKSLMSHDQIFADAMGRSRVVPGFFFVNYETEKQPMYNGRLAWSGTKPKDKIKAYQGAITPLTRLENKASGEGFVSFTPGRDGIIRQAPMLARIGDDYYRSLSLEAIRVALNQGAVKVQISDGTDGLASTGTENPEVSKVIIGPFTVPTTPKGNMLVYFTKPHPERYIPAWKILSDEIPASQWSDKIAGHIVYVGTGAIGLKDIKATPIRGGEPGVLIHAQVTEQIIGEQYLKRPYWAGVIELLTLAVSGLLLALTLPYLGALRGAVLSAVIAGGVAFSSWYGFEAKQFLLNPIYPLMAILTSYLLVTLSSFYLTETERSRIRSAFSMYLSPTMVKKVSEDPGLLTLGGEERNMTILFLDIRSFSKISEGLEPNEITTFLNIFLTPMTNILQDNQATIDKYIGDAIVAFWNAPLDDDKHEENAAHAVMEMMRSLDGLNEKYSQQDEIKWPKDVRMGIGLNTGVCCVGNLGSEQRFSYSMIGDAANLASRIEGLTKQYKVHVLVGNSTAEKLDGFAIIEADLIKVIGRQTPERIFVLAGEQKEAATEEYHALIPLHKKFLEAYRNQDWKTAEGLIPELEKLAKPLDFHGYYDVMRARINGYKIEPPEKDWGGVFVATSK